MNNRHKQVHPTQNRPQSRIGDALGITLREHFAGLAMQGLMASPLLSPLHPDNTSKVAARAVELADALCEELAK